MNGLVSLYPNPEYTAWPPHVRGLASQFYYPQSAVGGLPQMAISQPPPWLVVWKSAQVGTSAVNLPRDPDDLLLAPILTISYNSAATIVANTTVVDVLADAQYQPGRDTSLTAYGKRLDAILMDYLDDAACSWSVADSAGYVMPWRSHDYNEHLDELVLRLERLRYLRLQVRMLVCAYWFYNVRIINLPCTASFFLRLIAACYRYGRRSESADHLPPPPANRRLAGTAHFLSS